MSITHPNATHRTLAAVRDAYVGRTADGARLFVSIEVQHVTAETPRQTTGHEWVSEWDEVAMTYTVVEKGRSGDSAQSSGAGVGPVAETTGAAGTSWTDADRASLASLGHLHLSGMNAGCDHVAAVWEESRYGRRPSLDLTPACEVPVTNANGDEVPNGYRYGSAWLVRPLTAAQSAELVRLAGIDRGTVPAWL